MREQFGISPGTSVEVHEEEGKAVIKPENKPEQTLSRMDQVIKKATETRPPTPYGELDPIAGYYAQVAREEGIETVLTLNDEVKQMDEFTAKVILSPEEFATLNQYLG